MPREETPSSVHLELNQLNLSAVNDDRRLSLSANGNDGPDTARSSTSLAPDTARPMIAKIDNSIKVDPQYRVAQTFFGRYKNAWNPQGGVIKTALDYVVNYVPYRLTHRKPKFGAAPKVVDFNLEKFMAEDYAVSLLGHATVIIKIGNSVTLVDPVTADDVGAAFIKVPRVIEQTFSISEVASVVTAVCITHDHLDHLDAKCLQRIEQHARPFYFIGAGSSKILKKCGVTADRITELKWWESAKIPSHDLSISFVPAQHWSSRNVFDKNKRLWGGFVIATLDRDRSIYHCGDTGFDETLFHQIKTLGPFDLALLPIGCGTPQSVYGYQHTSAAQAVEISNIIQPHATVAVHWGSYVFKDVCESIMQPSLELKDLNQTSPPFTAPEYGTIVPVKDNEGGGPKLDNVISVDDMKEGDVILFKGMEVFALDRLIMDLTDSDVTHCAVYEGNGLIVEEEMDGARRSKIWDDMRNGRDAYVMRPKFSGKLFMGPVKKACDEYVVSNNPYGYDSIAWLALLVIFKRTLIPGEMSQTVFKFFEDAAYRCHESVERILQGDEDTLVCSEIVYKIFNSAPEEYHITIPDGVVKRALKPQEDASIAEQVIDQIDRDIETFKQMGDIAKQALIDDPIDFVRNKIADIFKSDKEREADAAAKAALNRFHPSGGQEISTEVMHAVTRLLAAFVGIHPGPEVKEHLGKMQEMSAYYVVPEDLKTGCPELEMVGMVRVGHDTTNRYSPDGEIIE
ncbi:Beta-lactamase superfamily domain [Carpediemonas membranifera]|uniref:Beta-lactamase superfamily domain n=1 Tax=Carpediemonas membranifera TaxID=201153 RepID=A0A8J6ATA5_9EUKA|nr:Beta-lactamase superfamily domain [Carpediemonas membranifera]|eukprot:KAG9390945.1 Beta-lactamase superfamily domain [Carpediemonas membranifera]